MASLHRRRPEEPGRIRKPRDYKLVSGKPVAVQYLYLGWKDYLNPSSAYFSILQRWDGNDGDAIHSNYIFTRPYKLGISTSKGISFKEYELNEANATGTEVLFVDGISMRRASFLGRY